jgi:hypothetical protein
MRIPRSDLSFSRLLELRREKMTEVQNTKHPHYPVGMVVDVGDDKASELIKSGLWTKVDSAVITKVKKIRSKGNKNVDEPRTTE